MYSFSLFLRDSASRLAGQSIDEETATHSDLTMNAPHGEVNSSSLQRFAPRKYVLINAVDKCSVQVEQESLSILALHHWSS
jgi:hypothetical protein